MCVRHGGTTRAEDDPSPAHTSGANAEPDRPACMTEIRGDGFAHAMGSGRRRAMKRLWVLPLVLFLAGTSNALAQDVRYNFDKQANFGTFRTYKWVPIKGAQPVSDLVDKQIKS